jgi:hypothetical protein
MEKRNYIPANAGDFELETGKISGSGGSDGGMPRSLKAGAQIKIARLKPQEAVWPSGANDLGRRQKQRLGFNRPSGSGRINGLTMKVECA